MSILSNFKRRRKVKAALANDATVQSCFRMVQAILYPQFMWCGFEPRFVPARGEAASAKARGYLVGLIEEMFLQHGLDSKLNDQGMVLLALAFQETYGAYGWNLALDTLDDLANHSSDAIFGYDWGKFDFQETGSGQPFNPAMGFARCSGKLIPEAAEMPAPFRD